MTITGQNFEMYQGDTKEIHIIVTDEETGLPLDLSPYVANDGIVWVLYGQTNKNIILSKSYGEGITVPVPSTGELIVTLLPTDTENVIPNTYNHECEISSSSTNVATVTTGTLKILYSRA